MLDIFGSIVRSENENINVVYKILNMRIERIYKTDKKNEIDDKIDLSLLNDLINKYKNQKGNMIPLLQRTQELYGYLPHKAILKISEETGLKLSEIYGVATFYAQFKLKPVGKYIIKACHGTACHVQNANSITDALEETLGIKNGETTRDKLFTLETVACLGCCSLAPVMMINNETYGKLTPATATKIVKNIVSKS